MRSAVVVKQTRKVKPIRVVLVGETYRCQVADVGFLVDEAAIDPGDWICSGCRRRKSGTYLALNTMRVA